MSIINDALKKVQTTCEKRIDQPKMPDRFDQEDPSKNSLVLIATVIIGTGFAGCLLVLAMILWPSSLTVERQVIDLSPQEKLGPKDGLTLNGIAKSGREGYALINNQVVREGDRINGKRILKISDNQVRIYHKGKVGILEIQK